MAEQKIKRSEKFQKRFRELLDYNKISTYQIAREVGVCQGTIWHWLDGYSEPSILKLVDLADALNVSVGQLVGTEDLEEV